MATKPKFRVELKSGYNGAQFQAEEKHVELTSENPSYETDDPNLFAALCELPFLKASTSTEKAKEA